MCTGDVADHLRPTLQVLLRALEVGDWPTVLRPDPSHPAARPVGGPAQLVQVALALRDIARSMESQADGDVYGASKQLAVALGKLPVDYGQTTDPTAATPPTRPHDSTFIASVTWRAVTIIWREQYELADLHTSFTPDLITPRGELVAACIEHMFWVEFDPYQWRRKRSRTPERAQARERTRRALCLRATRLRHFANATACDLSQSVWRDVGALPGLYAEALTQLAEQQAPAPWCGRKDTRRIPVRRGRLRAWQYARTWRDDHDYWR